MSPIPGTILPYVLFVFAIPGPIPGQATSSWSHPLERHQGPARYSCNKRQPHGKLSHVNAMGQDGIQRK